MDIRNALHRMTTPVLMLGRSDPELVRRVEVAQLKDERARRRKGLASLPAKTLTVATGLDVGALTVRPIDALARLARVTALTVEDDVFAAYAQWGWLRYLGAFDHMSTPPQLALDGGAIRYVHANQRRVMSEELGVGFGVLLAEEWCRSQGASGTIRTVDVDKALRDHVGFPGLAQAPGSQRQPDYLLQFASPTSPGTLESRLLETKGTVSASNAISQLAHAGTQLASLVLDGVTPQGIAISTISSEAGVTYLAVDPDGNVPPWKPDPEVIDRAKWKRPSVEKGDGLLKMSRDEFFASATVTANAGLADFAGLNETAARWLPEDAILQTRRRSKPYKRISTDRGDYSGAEFEITAPGGEGLLTVFQGVERAVEEALESGSDDRVRAAQDRFSRAHDERPTLNDESSDQVATSINSEGAILRISLRDR